MDKLLFSDLVGKFHFFDYNHSHHELLFRKYKSAYNEYNIDIFFKGVHSLNINTVYRGITIFILPFEEAKLCTNTKVVDYVFKISDCENNESFIAASVFGVFHNNLHFSETSLGEFTWSEANKLVFWSNDSLD